jgi:GNAT superfamily N-acetyltransferase
MKFHPLTPELWPDFEKLLGPRGAFGGCWCMVWRLPKAEWERGKGDGNRLAMRELVESGVEPGILGYADGEAVAWCSVAPREVFVRLRNAPSLAPVDDQPVWSITCFFFARKWRRKGVSVELLKAAAEFVRGGGGRLVEGYPVIPKGSENAGCVCLDVRGFGV